jgi:predicted HNH restriction endonuclease
MSELPDEEDVMLSPRDDFAVVCAYCHRMLHRPPFITVEDLKRSIGT